MRKMRSTCCGSLLASPPILLAPWVESWPVIITAWCGANDLLDGETARGGGIVAGP